ncbi:interferon-gamma-inducible GTPase 10 isoform X2 [Trichomycterus rosablanca]
MDFGLMVPPKIPEEHLSEIIKAVQSIGPEEIANQFITSLEVFNRFKVDIAVTGDSGSGKSTLINALRGLDSDAKGAAPTGVVETTMVPAIYQYPHHPSLRLYDLPGMGTLNFTSKSYVEKMNFDLYDLFIVVISERFRENNTLLIDEIQKRQKHFFVVRTKVDNELRSQSKKQNFNKNDALKLMEQDCLKYLNEKNLKSEVFLVSAHDPQNYDMPKFIDTLQKTALELKREIFISFLDSLFKGNHRKAMTIKNHAFETDKLREEDLQELEKFSRGSNFSDKTKALSIVLETLDHFQLDVAVLGETGSGGTTLVNAITREQNGARVPATSPHYPHVRF